MNYSRFWNIKMCIIWNEYYQLQDDGNQLINKHFT